MNRIDLNRGGSVKMRKPVMMLLLATSCVAGGFLTQLWRARGYDDESGDAENIS